MTIDFRASQNRTNKLISSGSTGTGAKLLIYDVAAASNLSGSINTSIFQTGSIGTDIWMYLSGSTQSSGNANTFFRDSTQKVALGGDLFVSGNIISDKILTTRSGIFLGDSNLSINPFISYWSNVSALEFSLFSWDSEIVYLGNLSETLFVRGMPVIVELSGTSTGFSVDAYPARSARDLGTDVFFFVSGSNNDVSLFSGNVVVSGNIKALQGFSGSHHKLKDGTSAFIAGDNITIVTQSNGAVVISGSAGGVVLVSSSYVAFGNGSNNLTGSNIFTFNPSAAAGQANLILSGNIFISGGLIAEPSQLYQIFSETGSQDSSFGGNLIVSGALIARNGLFLETDTNGFGAPFIHVQNSFGNWQNFFSENSSNHGLSFYSLGDPGPDYLNQVAGWILNGATGSDSSSGGAYTLRIRANDETGYSHILFSIFSGYSASIPGNFAADLALGDHDYMIKGGVPGNATPARIHGASPGYWSQPDSMGVPLSLESGVGGGYASASWVSIKVSKPNPIASSSVDTPELLKETAVFWGDQRVQFPGNTYANLPSVSSSFTGSFYYANDTGQLFFHNTTSHWMTIADSPLSRLSLAYGVSTTNTSSSPKVCGQNYYQTSENGYISGTSLIALRTILSVAGVATGSVQLYNVTSGSYVHIGGPGITAISTSQTTPTKIESVNLVNATNFSTSSIYEVQAYTSNASISVILGGAEILTSH